MTAPRERNVFSIAAGVAGNRCPRCFEGAVWATIWRMHRSCPSCGLLYFREPGYFTGATPISYGVGATFAVPVFLVLLATQQPIWVTLGVPVLMLAVMAPFLVRFSRLLLLHADPTPFPEDPANPPVAPTA